ncbi:MAG: RHS repeat-associated core domain-containing protein [Christensenellales bacterium]
MEYQNAQGDIVKLIDKTGSTVVEYTYDTWGKLLSTTGSLAATFGAEQPFRYRGYVYDEETGFYYLQSRYYNPEVGRFISADVYLSTGQGVIGHNAYAYCGNNPVNMTDESGQWSLPNWAKIAIGAVALVGAIALTVATGSPNSMGRVGEKMAGIDRSQEKAIRINGRVRIPDELTQTTLKEVKMINTFQI